MPKMRVWRLAPFFVGVVLCAAAPVARADVASCQRGIAKETASFVQKRSKLLAQCEDKRLAAQPGAATPCVEDPTMGARLAKLATKLQSRVSGACSGASLVCVGGAGTGTVGWPPACPDFENRGCTDSIATCSDIGACVTCIGTDAVDQALALYYDALAPSEFGTKSPVNLCQRTIGKAAQGFMKAKSKVLRKCWDGRLRGRHANPCPEPGDGRATPKIERARTRMESTICRACGGPDRSCDGVDDLSPATIGFVPQCDDVTVPGGRSCGGNVTTLRNLVNCVGCVTDF